MNYVQKEKILLILINIGYNFDGCKNRSKMRGGPSAEKRQKKNQLLPRHRKKDERIQIQPRHTKRNTLKSHILGRILCLWKKLNVHFPLGVPNYIFWKKWSCWGWKKQFQWYYCMWWQCSHSCSVYSQSLFLRLKKTSLKIHLMI